MSFLRIAALVSLAASVWSPAAAQSAENVAVVINENSDVSRRIGEYYIAKRGIPASNVLRIRTSTQETIDRNVYTALELALGLGIARAGIQDRLLYLVLTKGVPIRVGGSGGQDGTVASVDSELTLLYRRMTGENNLPVRGRIDNPYFRGTKDPSEAAPFTHREYDIYLVTRLDAFTEKEALGLVDKALAPSTEGRIVLDQQDKLVNRTGEQWLEAAAKRLTAQGQGARVLLEGTVEPARNVSGVLGYYSWGSNDPRNRVRTVGMGFVPGALAATFVSSDGRTFQEPPPGWMPNEGESDKSKWFAGSPQSLIADLLREGATGVAGHVAEPYLQSTIRPDILFPAYLAGSNLAEAFYMAMPHLSWQTVVIGDPLCAPFRRKVLTRPEIEGPIDTSTALPSFFSKRRLAIASAAAPDLPARAVTSWIHADTLTSRGDAAGAQALLEEVTQLAPMFVSAQMALAVIYDQNGQHDAAIDRYRRVLDVQPKNFVAMNNLAYGLAVHKKMPDEALPLARNAVALAPQAGTILDTLAWIEHLTGDDASAAKRMPLAVQGAPRDPDVRLHAAIIYAAVGARAVARNELAEALKLKPELEKSEEVKRVRAQLARPAAK